jgi:hypothetical protein
MPNALIAAAGLSREPPETVSVARPIGDEHDEDERGAIRTE